MIRITLVLLPALILLSGCTGLGLATGAAAVTGIAAAQEGGIKRAVSDGAIKLKINEAWFNYDVNTFAKLKTKVNQRRVLITGVVQDPQDRVEAVRLAWQVNGVEQVINEIRVAESKGITGFVKDGYITTRLRTQLTFDRQVQSINYSIDTVQGVVFLMGVAQNQAELNQVIETARMISGVKQVVSYVKLAGEPIEEMKRNESLANPSKYESPQQLVPTNSNLNTRPEDNDYSGKVYIEKPQKIEQETIQQEAISDQYYN